MSGSICPRAGLRPATVGFRLLLLAVLLSAVAPTVYAQAWVSPKGRGLLTFSYQNQDLGTQLTTGGVEIEAGDVSGDVGFLSLDYSLTDRLGLSAGVAYTIYKFEGGSGNHGTQIDDGSSHGTWQDGSIILRYVALEGPVVITPFVGFGAPLTDYEALGMAAPGRNLEQIPAGVAFGWRPSDFYVHARYTYLFVEELQGIDTDRWLSDLELGYIFSPRIAASLFGSYQESTGGVDLLDVQSGALPEVVPIHDQVVALDEWRAGVRVDWAINNSFQLSGNYSQTLSGRNLQENRALGLSFGWSFSTGAARRIESSKPGSIDVLGAEAAASK